MLWTREAVAGPVLQNIQRYEVYSSLVNKCVSFIIINLGSAPSESFCIKLVIQLDT
jgi:hypothetical protein